MQYGDPNDPLFRQVWPDAREAASSPGYIHDPLAEQQQDISGGLLHKYAGRALMLVTGACPVHCRYCFRRHFPYAGHAGSAAREEGLTRLREAAGIEEVILSGGDPLSLATSSLQHLLHDIAAIPHVATIRIHTRLPVVLPERITQTLIDVFAAVNRNLVIVVHANHPNEIDAVTGEALAKLACVSTLLNQSVLLAGINDEAAVLAALSRALLRHGALPYYLHQLDKVAGAAHFAVSDQRALAIVAQLREQVAGYLVPRLVREVPGQRSKSPLV